MQCLNNLKNLQYIYLKLQDSVGLIRNNQIAALICG